MSRLRSPGGCPWDREQTFDTIKPYTLEECYEVLDAIDRKDWSGLSEELGDYLLQAVFYAQMASEQNLFTIDDALDAINSKLVRRHPHVFGEAEANTPDEVKRNWDQIKKEEKAARGERPKSILDGTPRSMPALVEAQQIASKAAAAGFDWENVEQVFDKMREELSELAEARNSAIHEDIEDEFGDILFALTQLARRLKLNSEDLLTRSCNKFIRRFKAMENRAKDELSKLSIDELDKLWEEVKSQE